MGMTVFPTWKTSSPIPLMLPKFMLNCLPLLMPAPIPQTHFHCHPLALNPSSPAEL